MKYAVNLILLLATVSLVSGCASSRVVAPAEGCSVFGEPLLGRVVGHATLGDTGDAALDWQLYGTAETVNLNQSERDKRDGLSLIQTCEARDQRAYRRINAPWYAFWAR